MENRLGKLIELIQKMPEDCLDDAIEYIEGKIEEHSAEKPIPPCPHCKSDDVTKFGVVGGKQRFRCNECSRTYGEATNTIMSHSHFGEAAWKQVIRDTVGGVSLDATAATLLMSHSTAFIMRHKILLALEAEEARVPTVLDGVCELDDTYVLESYKGSKLPEGFWRKARKHGAVAQKRGISHEYICISTGIQRDGAAYAQTVTRASPGKEALKAVFEGHIGGGSLILCDGAASYNAVGESAGCPVLKVEHGKGFSNLNTANGFHSFIKERYEQFRGVATKYLNRYNALFAGAYRNGEKLVDKIYNMLCSNDIPRHYKVSDVNALNLLDI